MLSRSPLSDQFPLAVVSRELEHALRSAFPSSFAGAGGGGLAGGRGMAGPARAVGLIPPVDIDESDDAYKVHVELPGVRPDEVEVALEGTVLTVSGVREFYADRDEAGFVRRERRFGRFARAVKLPGKVDAEKVSASARDGVVTVTVAKAAEVQPRRVEVRPASD